MISNVELIKKCNGNVAKVCRMRGDIVFNLKKALNTYFKALNLNYTVSDYNNGDLRVIVKNETYTLSKLLDMYNIKHTVEQHGKFKTYCIYVFKA